MAHVENGIKWSSWSSSITFALASLGVDEGVTSAEIDLTDQGDGTEGIIARSFELSITVTPGATTANGAFLVALMPETHSSATYLYGISASDTNIPTTDSPNAEEFYGKSTWGKAYPIDTTEDDSTLQRIVFRWENPPPTFVILFVNKTDVATTATASATQWRAGYGIIES